MNKIFVAFALTALTFASCREKGAIINTSGAKAVDSTYISGVEQPQAKVVLLEEFTGVQCVPCVTGHQIIYGANGILSQHPGQVAVIAYHIYGHPLAEPKPPHSKFDLRTEDATDVSNTIFGKVGSLPAAGIDRRARNNSYSFDKADWPQLVNDAINNKPPVNLYLTSTFIPSTRQVNVELKLVYTQKLEKKQSITLALVENDIIDGQKTDGLNGDVFDDNYVHHAVLRDIITQYYGDPVLDSLQVKEPGRVYERSFSYNINPAWNVDNCKFVAFVHNNEGVDKDVLQAAETTIKQ